MKLTVSFLPLISFLLMGATSATSRACGPYYPLIPTPEYFGIKEMHRQMLYYEREENLRSWQQLLPAGIPIADIEEKIYKDTTRNGNLFDVYLMNSGDYELDKYISLAKEMEKRWSRTWSPWYYPQSRDDDSGCADFCDIISECRDYKGKRLRDRYALQAVRALFASRRYAACIGFYDSAFVDIPEKNIMKRMAQRLVAGCWSRLGDKRRADSLFALSGDILSLSVENPTEYMARHNPDAPTLIEYVRSRANDTAFMKSMVQIARRLLKDYRVKNKGDWHFMLAYVFNEFDNDPSAARREICLGLRNRFSSDAFHDLARAYKMKLDGSMGRTESLLADLKWIEGKAAVLNPDAREWIRRCRNIIYVNWVPTLWEKGDYATAILLCGYADNFDPSESWSYYDFGILRINDIRHNAECFNPVDYGCLSFRMMNSLPSGQLASVYRKIGRSKPLYAFLRRKARTDRDYFYEVIGTLAMKEEKYALAERYFAAVSPDYFRTMNLYKQNCFRRDPFNPKKLRWTILFASESNSFSKINFARQMCRYQQVVKTGRTADERGMARLMYAIGRHSSFTDCWALTAYSSGDPSNLFCPELQYWDDDFADRKYSFLSDYKSADDFRRIDEEYERDVAAALAMLATDEARAKANYILGNLAVVVRRYGDTAVGRHIKTSCDHWQRWL